MNLVKSFEFFDPTGFEDDIHIIGCGSVGSTVAELLSRFGFKNFDLYDFDEVSDHNIVNQMFTSEDINKPKTECVARHLAEINPEITCTIHENGYTKQKLSGYVFLCVDNIELRKKIVTDNKLNIFIKGMFDFRTRLTEAQHYAANWKDKKSIEKFYSSMDFTTEEAAKATEVSACGVSLCVAPTVRLICNVGVCNFINFIKGEELKGCIVTDAFKFFIEEF